MDKVKSRKIRKKEDNTILTKDDINEVEEKEVIGKNRASSYLKVRKRKIKNNVSDKDEVIVSKDEYMDQEDKNILDDDNFSMGLMIFILVACVIVGVVLGYLLYRLAINSSAIY